MNLRSDQIGVKSALKAIIFVLSVISSDLMAQELSCVELFEGSYDKIERHLDLVLNRLEEKPKSQRSHLETLIEGEDLRPISSEKMFELSSGKALSLNPRYYAQFLGKAKDVISKRKEGLIVLETEDQVDIMIELLRKIFVKVDFFREEKLKQNGEVEEGFLKEYTASVHKFFVVSSDSSLLVDNRDFKLLVGLVAERRLVSPVIMYESKKRVEMLSYEEAQKEVQSAKIILKKDFHGWENRPENIPSSPETYYKKQGKWIDWPTFLGTKKFTYEEAFAYIQAKKFKTLEEFYEWRKGPGRPRQFPYEPNVYYRDSGWPGSYKIFLGFNKTKNVDNINQNTEKMIKNIKDKNSKAKSSWGSFKNFNLTPKPRVDDKIEVPEEGSY